jgi:hypothetical protein
VKNLTGPFLSVPPIVNDIDRNVLIQFSGLVSGLMDAFNGNSAVLAAFQDVLREVGTLILQTSKSYFQIKNSSSNEYDFSTATTSTTTTTSTVQELLLLPKISESASLERWKNIGIRGCSQRTSF